jgi:hypothetical protein
MRPRDDSTAFLIVHTVTTNWKAELVCRSNWPENGNGKLDLALPETISRKKGLGTKTDDGNFGIEGERTSLREDSPPSPAPVLSFPSNNRQKTG